MDDMLEKLSQILSTDEGKDQLKTLASMFGSNENIGDLLGGVNDTPPAPQQNESNPFSSLLPDGINMDMIKKLAPILSKLNSQTDDKNSQLILALKPHLKPENQHRADEAAQMLKLMTILPNIKDIGLF